MTFDWYAFLKQWSKEITQSNRRNEFVPSEMIENEWLGYPPATEEEIAALEARLNVTLPPSYRAFLRVSNGWTISHQKFFPTQDVNLYVSSHAEEASHWISAIRNNSELATIKEHVIRSIIEIGTTIDFGDSYLLNPTIANESGEWEGWYDGSDRGLVAFESFEALILDVYKTDAHQRQFEVGRYRTGDDILHKLPELEKSLQYRITQYQDLNDSSPSTIARIELHTDSLEKIQQIRATAQNSDEALQQLQTYVASCKAEVENNLYIFKTNEIDAFSSLDKQKQLYFPEVVQFIDYWLNE